MSRKDRFVFQLLLLLAAGTFLFGIWSLVSGLKQATTTPKVPANTVTAPAK